MAGLVFHVAVAVLVASLFRLEGWLKYVVVAITLLPAVTPWVVHAVEPLMAWLVPDADASTERVVGWLLAPGGGLETLTAAVVVGLLGLLVTVRPRARTWRPRIGLALGVGWAAYMFVELVGPGKVHPFWPWSPVGVDFALVETNAPLFVALGLFYLAGEWMADVWKWDHRRATGETPPERPSVTPRPPVADDTLDDPDDEAHRMGPRTRLVLRKFGPRLAKGAYRFAAIALLVLVVMKVSAAAGAPVVLDGMVPATFPMWTEVTGTPQDGYHVAPRDAFSAAEAGTDVPRVPPGLSTRDAARAEAALCLAGGLGPFMDLHHPVVVSSDAGHVVVAEAHRAVLDDAGLPQGAWQIVFRVEGMPTVVTTGDGVWSAVHWSVPSAFVAAGGCV